MTGLTALVLAGSRAGVPDPMAAAAGVAHKALLPVAGVAMLHRVLGALLETPGIGRIVVCAQRAAAFEGLDDASGRVLVREAASGPSASVAAMLGEFGTPLLVTTADHALLSPAMLSHFIAHAPPGIDVVAGLATEATVRARFPETRRTWLRFRDGAFSGCNLFLLQGPAACRTVAFWERLERDRKRPLAMARLLGPASLALYGLRLVTLQGMLRRLGLSTGASLGVVDLPFAEAAIDVDKPEDLALAEHILLLRGRDAAGEP